MRRRALVAVLSAASIALALACGGGSSGAPKATPTATATKTPAAAATEAPRPAAIPNTTPATELTLPPGFTAYVVATGFSSPTSIALAPDGGIYVSEEGGSVYRLVDADRDGVFDDRTTFASGFDELTGLVFAQDGTLYASSRGKVTTLLDTDGDGVADQQNDIITGLPVGRHQNDGLVFGPDGKLYISLGSTCDDCNESDPRSATILQANPDGSGLRIYARGLRNAYDLVWDGRGRLWATDNGSDAPCATIDELDLIVDGGDYGWPYSEKGCDAMTAGLPPAADLGLHTASTGITEYTGAQFPPAYRTDLFLTLWGSFFATPEPVSQVLMRVVIDDASGQPRATTQVFASGFQHPIDVIVDRDGTLLVLDYGSDDSGKLYRIVYTGG